MKKAVIEVRYLRPESNRHTFRYTILSRARLPVPPLRRDTRAAKIGCYWFFGAILLLKLESFCLFLSINKIMMKKILLTAVGFALMVLSQAQSLQIVSFDTVVMGNAFTSDDIYAKAAIKNTSSTAKVVKVKRYYDVNNALVDSNAICWGFCFEPKVSVSPIGISIAAGATNSVDFSGHVYPDKDGVARSGQIMYTFFVDESPNDSVSIVVTFEVTPTFSVAKLQTGSRVGSVYPNPAGDVVEFFLDLKGYEQGRIAFTDITGRVVKSVQLSNIDAVHRINVHDLKPGVYLYTVYINGRAEVTRRLTVKR